METMVVVFEFNFTSSYAHFCKFSNSVVIVKKSIKPTSRLDV